MKSKLISIGLGLAALSAVFASAASASPVLTENGTALLPGAAVRATNVGNVLVTTPLGTSTCIQTTMNGNVVANTGSQIEIEFSSVAFVTCSGPFATKVEARSLPWCWKASSKMTADTFELRGGKCGEEGKPLTLLVNESCPYTRTASTGSIRTAPEDALLTMPEQEFARETGSICPTPIKLDVNYTLETATSETRPLTIS